MWCLKKIDNKNSHKRKDKNPMDLKIGAKTLRSKDIIGFITGFKKNRRCSPPPPPPVENKKESRVAE